MILNMAKVRVLGARDRLDETLRALQDFGLLHLGDASDEAGVRPLPLPTREARRRRQLAAMIEDVDAALRELGGAEGAAEHAPSANRPPPLARWARLARRTRLAADRLARRRAALDEERALILKYRDFFSTFLSLLRTVARSGRLTAYAVIIPAAARAVVDRLQEALTELAGAEWAIRTQPLASGDLAVLLVLPREAAARIEAMLAEARVPEIPVPAAYAGMPLADAAPKMLARLDEIPRELSALGRERASLARSSIPDLRRARAAAHDAMASLEAMARCGATRHAFVLEGWLPADAVGRLTTFLGGRLGDDVAVEAVAREQWESEGAPVVLRNPRLFRPFEALISIMPLPRYGSIDPTPFVAIFFPLFFGVILGDIGYGVLLAAIGLFLRVRSRPGTVLRSVSEIAGACAAFSVVFGAVYGELFGDLGAHLFGMHPLHPALHREETVTAALAVAVGLGLVHVLLGLVLGAVAAWHGHRRQAVGRGVTALMIVFIVLALLAAFEVLPSRFFTPAVVAILVAFPVLIVAEGVFGAIELFSTLGNILSYARIMALGTASVMLAVVANRMVGAIGSTAVGLLFALLFHLVNFAIGLFSPTIHALRLHYVEFFGKFYSPGGRPYRPFAHWRGEGRAPGDGALIPQGSGS
jgi:V/A-type H+-transporting ATPase subunit I